MNNIIIKGITKKVYFFYFSLSYRYFSMGYYLCKKIYSDSLNNELKNKTSIPFYVILYKVN